MKTAIVIFSILWFSIYYTISFANEQKHEMDFYINMVKQNEKEILVNQPNEDNWIELGEITLIRKQVHSGGQLRYVYYEDGYDKLPFNKIKAILYVKEFNSGRLIYRVTYQGTNYVVQSDGKVCMNITYNGQHYKNVIFYCTLPT